MARKATRPAAHANGDANAVPGTVAITIQGLIFHVRAPYAEGHTLSQIEAQALNRLRAENVRNNCADKVKSAKETGADASAVVEAYDQDYSFASVRTRAPVDPVQRELLRIATSKVSAAVQAKGFKLKDLPDGKLDALVEQAIAGHPEWRAEAERRIAEAADEAASLLGDLDLTPAKAPIQEEAQA